MRGFFLCDVSHTISDETPSPPNPASDETPPRVALRRPVAWIWPSSTPLAHKGAGGPRSHRQHQVSIRLDSELTSELRMNRLGCAAPRNGEKINKYSFYQFGGFTH